MNARFADLTLSEAARRLGRYRPLVLTLVVTLGTLHVLPEQGSAVEESLAPAAPVTATSPSPPSPPAEPAPRPPSPPSGLPAPRPVAPTPTRAARPPAKTATTPSVPSVPVAAPSEERPAATPRTVLHTGWATQAAGTPAGTIGVPEGSLPVGNRLGQTNRASFLRLVGSWETLILVVEPEGSAGIGAAAVQACAITTEDWEPEPGSSFEDAPTWNVDDCAPGVPAAAGDRWSFDVGAIDSRFGVALVPAPDAPVEFQIAFRTPS